MLLQQIVETLDAELDRLYRLRTIVSSIEGSLALSAAEPVFPRVEPITAEPLLPEAEPVPSPKPVPSRRARPAATVRPRVSKELRQTPAEGAALSGSIPAGPVVVSPAALAKEHAAKHDGKSAQKALPPPSPPGSLGSMIRALRLDGTM